MEYRILETQYKGIDTKFQPQCRYFGDKEWRNLSGHYSTKEVAKKIIDSHRKAIDDQVVVRTVVHEFS